MSPSLYAAIVSATILVVTSALLSGVWLLLRMRGEAQVRRRLDPEKIERDRDLNEPGTAPVMQRLARGGRKLEQIIDAEGESAKLMMRAGWRSMESRIAWYAFQAALPLILFSAVFLFWLFSEMPQRTLFGLLLLVVAAILGFLAPRWILRSVAASRQRRISREVPLLIHLLVLLFESGLSTRQALASIVRDGGGVLPELGREFELIIRQIEAGADTGETLKEVEALLEVEDLNSVLGVLRQVERYGGELREPLLETLEVLEERRGYALRERVNLLSGRMTVVMVLFFFPALMIFVAGPAFMSIIEVLKDVNG